jgi:hypothetical protein
MDLGLWFVAIHNIDHLNQKLHKIQEFSPYHEENSTSNITKLFKEVIHIYTDNHTKPINTKCVVTDC